MANISREERARRAAEQTDEEVIADGLIEMTDGKTTLRLHPDCVAEHQRLGWEIVE